MRLVVKQNDHIINELSFDKGPVYIGRHSHSQVFLSSDAVSRQHAVIFPTQDGKWTVEDLDSTNKTYLNDEAIHKAEIKSGDVLHIADFTIEIDLDTDADKAIHLEDTLTLSRGPQIIVREPNAEQAPPLRMPAKRAREFMEATDAICKANDLDEVLQALLHFTERQFCRSKFSF